MASTYSDLKIELIATGEQSGTWGTTTNNNLGNTALGEAITGSADVAFSSADVTVTLTDTNASQTARNLRLNLTGTTGGARSLILGSGCQIEKLYLVNNTCADAITVKNTTGTGIAVPAGKTMFVFNNGTNVVDATTYLSSLTLGSALPVASGGTGATSNAATAFALKGANSDITSITGLTTPLTIAQGGIGATTLPAATIATLGYTTTVTAAGTTTLTVSSTATQFFTGSTTQTVVLPVASTLTQGQQFIIHNKSSGSVTVNSSGSNLVGTVTANTTAVLTCILTSGTSAASWDFDITGFTTALTTARGGTGLTSIGTANQVLAVNAGATALEFQNAASGGTGTPFKNSIYTSSTTYTKSSGATYAVVSLTGGGGGSGGSGASGNTGGAGNAGNASSFGSYVTHNGGNGGGGGTGGANGNNGNTGSGVISSPAYAFGANQGQRAGLVSYGTAQGGGGANATAYPYNSYFENEQTIVQYCYGGNGGSAGVTSATIPLSGVSTVAITIGNAGNAGNAGGGNPGNGGAPGQFWITEFFA
jgi:hypothetical protein